MRITVPVEIIRLTVPTCTPSRDKPLVIVSPLELGGDGLHIFVWVVQLVGCLGNLLWEHRRLTALAQAVGASLLGVFDASLRMHRLHDVLQFFETSLKNRIVKN